MNFFIHQRLRDHRLILLVVTKAAEADHVEKHIFVEDGAVVERDLGDQQAGFRIVGIDVKDRHFGHLCNVGAIQRRAHIARVAGGEANLIVDHDMHRATGAVMARLR